jgi:hypothetical protein
MRCARCRRATRPSNSMRRYGQFRDWQGDESLITAARSDGTCSRCDDQMKRAGSRFGLGGYQPTEEEIVERGRREVQAYFADRRSRGVAPEGNADLDKAFEADVETGAWKLPRSLARRSNAKQRASIGLEPRTHRP